MPVSAKKSPQIRLFQLVIAILTLSGWIGVESATAQVLKARITVASLAPARVLVACEAYPTDTWSFRNVHSGIVGLGERIDRFQALEGEKVEVRKLAPGEFRTNKKVSKFSYEVAVDEPARPADTSHVSWLNRERGFLMLGDLLPGSSSHPSAPTMVEFQLPSGWRVNSAIRPDTQQQFTVPQIDDSVFYVGRSLVEKSVRLESMELSLITSGEWAFAETEALKVASRVIKEYARISQHRLTGRFVVMLAPYPAQSGPGRWTAETRGSSVVLLMGSQASRQQLLATLGILFTHELFHFWVPNALALEGDYDWFFEGFTLYQALLTALRLDFIKFDDYLVTMARVYDSYRALPDGSKLSLIEAAGRRWTSPASFIYDKGMLVAFVYDQKLRHLSGNGASITNIYPQLFGSEPARRGNANEVIMSLLSAPIGMNHFADEYVRSNQDIDLGEVLAPYGLQVETNNFRTRISVKQNLTPEQRRLFRSLGYKS